MQTTSKQAEKVISKFDGVPQLQEMLTKAGYEVTRATIYRWTYPSDRGGCNGHIPSRWIEPIKRTALLNDVEISDQDLAP